MKPLAFLMALLSLYVSAPQDFEDNIKIIASQTQEQKAEKIEFETITIEVSNDGGRYKYALSRTDKGMELVYSCDYYDYEDEPDTKTEFTKAQYNEFCSLLAELDVLSWDGFRGEDPGVDDGEGITFDMVCGEKKIHASGSNAYPENFSLFRQMTDEMREGIFKPNKYRNRLRPEDAEPITKFDKFTHSQIYKAGYVSEYTAEHTGDGVIINYYWYYTEKGRGEPSRSVTLSEKDYTEICREFDRYDILDSETADTYEKESKDAEYVFRFTLEYNGQTKTVDWVDTRGDADETCANDVLYDLLFDF